MIYLVMKWMLLVCVLFGSTLLAAKERPNIILLVVDDLGWNDVGFRNPEMHTPQIDRLLTENVRLDRFYVAPQCSPTRAGLMTGRYPHRFDMLDGVISPLKASGLPPNEYTLAEMLADSGYKHRGMIGKWHLGLRSKIFHPLNHGFSEFYGHYNGAIDYFRRVRAGEPDWHRDYEPVTEEGYATDLLTEEAVRFVEEKSKGEEPYFLYLSYNAPHSPMQALEEDLRAEGFDESLGRIESDDIKLARREGDLDYGRSGTGNTLRQTFKANLRALDRGIGRLMTAIEESGESDNTLIIFTSDNGGVPGHGGSNVPLRGNKFEIYEGGVRVTAALRWPAKFDRPKTVDATLAYIDVWPTLAEIVGAETSGSTIDGESMLPRVRGEESDWDRTLYLRDGGVIHGKWKLVLYQKKCDKYLECGELFDLKEDPYESENLIKEMSDKARELYALVEEYWKLSGSAFESKATFEKSEWPPGNWELSDEPNR